MDLKRIPNRFYAYTALMLGVVIILIFSVRNFEQKQMAPEQVKAEAKVREKEIASQAEEAKKAAADLAAWQATPSGKICIQHPEWSKDACDTIADKKVKIGMNTEQAAAGWGKPNDINRTTNSYGVREQWVYSSGSYLYFDDGVLTSISN